MIEKAPRFVLLNVMYLGNASGTNHLSRPPAAPKMIQEHKAWHGKTSVSLSVCLGGHLDHSREVLAAHSAKPKPNWHCEQRR